jgi:hypothetical protein
MVARFPGGADEVLEAYFRAKDGNRPRLAERAFHARATLEIRNRSDAIAFPSVTRGAAAIADVLVRQFGRSYDDVCSFYLQRPAPDATAFSCDWLVGMTAKDDRTVRVGCGRYDWTLQPTPAWRATRLVITIEAMQVLPAAEASGVYAWLEQLAYPWSRKREHRVRAHAGRGRHRRGVDVRVRDARRRAAVSVPRGGMRCRHKLSHKRDEYSEPLVLRRPGAFIGKRA